MLGPAGNSVKHLKAQACDTQLTVPWVSNTKTIFVGLRPRARSVPLWAPPDGCVTGACAPGPALHLGPPLQGPFNWGPFLRQSSKGLACVWQPSVLCAGSQQPSCGPYCKRFLCPLVPLLFLAVEHPPPPAAVTLADLESIWGNPSVLQCLWAQLRPPDRVSLLQTSWSLRDQLLSQLLLLACLRGFL